MGSRPLAVHFVPALWVSVFDLAVTVCRSTRSTKRCVLELWGGGTVRCQCTSLSASFTRALSSLILE
eukprot:1686580-Rhodomonas_salina.1